MLTLYQFPLLYGLAMRAAYGADYRARLTLLADHVGEAADVLELCCGDLALHRHLAARGRLAAYRGLEQAPAFLRLARRRGVDVRAWDVREPRALPAADVVIMQASLYQFHDGADALLGRLWTAARRRLVIAEPVRNLAQSGHPLLRGAARLLTRTHDRVHLFRYTEATLLALYARAGLPVSRLDRTPGGREVVVSSWRAAPAAFTAAPARGPGP